MNFQTSTAERMDRISILHTAPSAPAGVLNMLILLLVAVSLSLNVNATVHAVPAATPESRSARCF